MVVNKLSSSFKQLSEFLLTEMWVRNRIFFPQLSSEHTVLAQLKGNCTLINISCDIGPWETQNYIEYIGNSNFYVNR